MEEAGQSLQILSSIVDVYPETRNELFNRHSALLESLTAQFQALYEDCQLEHFVVVRGVVDLLALDQDTELSFAMDNGVTLLVSRQDRDGSTYINANRFHEELIFDDKGLPIEGQNHLSYAIQKMIAYCTKGKEELEKTGAIIMLHSGLAEGTLYELEALQLALFIGLLVVHERFQNITKQQICDRLIIISPELNRQKLIDLLVEHTHKRLLIKNSLTTLDKLPEDFCDEYDSHDHSSHENTSEKLSSKSIDSRNSEKMKNLNRSQFDVFTSLAIRCASVKEAPLGSRCDLSSYRTKDTCEGEDSREWKKSESFLETISTQSQSKSGREPLSTIYASEQHKFIMTKLQLAPQQLAEHQAKLNEMKQMNESIKAKFTQHRRQQRKTLLCSSGSEDQRSDQGMMAALTSQERRYLSYYRDHKSLLDKLQTKEITLTRCIREKWLLDRKYQLHNEQVYKLAETVKAEIPCLKQYLIVQGTFLLIIVPKLIYAEVLRVLRRLVNAKMFATQKFLEEEHEHSQSLEDQQIGEIMFTAAPSAGVAVYKPQQDGIEL